MSRKINSRMAEANRKTANISIRCTENLEKKIKEKAEQMGESVSEFVLDCIETRLKKNGRHDKDKARALVEIQEKMNQLVRELKPEQKEIEQQLIEFMERGITLWDY